MPSSDLGAATQTLRFQFTARTSSPIQKCWRVPGIPKASRGLKRDVEEEEEAGNILVCPKCLLINTNY